MVRMSLRLQAKVGLNGMQFWISAQVLTLRGLPKKRLKLQEIVLGR